MIHINDLILGKEKYTQGMNRVWVYCRKGTKDIKCQTIHIISILKLKGKDNKEETLNRQWLKILGLLKIHKLPDQNIPMKPKQEKCKENYIHNKMLMKIFKQPEIRKTCYIENNNGIKDSYQTLEAKRIWYLKMKKTKINLKFYHHHKYPTKNSSKIHFRLNLEVVIC